MRECDSFYIDGAWVKPADGANAGWFTAIDPATETPNGRVALGSAVDVDRAVKAAKAAFASFSQTTRDGRIALLERIAAGLAKRRDDLTAALVHELGCAAWLAQGGQQDMPEGHLRTAIEVLKGYSFEHQAGTTLVQRVPIGVCGLITPWNWPLLAIMTKLAPALATGCTVVWKPSEYAAFSAQVFTEILHDAGVPAGVVNIVYGDGNTVGAVLSSHPLVEMVSITGSTRAGVEVARNAAPTVKRVHQELGGKSPNVVLDDADFGAAIGACVQYVSIHAGQNCTTPTRLLVPRSRLAEAEAIAKASADAVTVGLPHSGAFMGPVVNKSQWQRIQKLIQQGIDEGATLLTGGTGRPEGLSSGYFVKPTIFSDVRNDMTIAREEIFGPVLVIIPYESEEGAIEIANDTPYGLAAYVHSGNLERARRVGRQLRAGQVLINGDLNLLDLNAPFGGRKMSGNGREFGAAGFEAFTEEVAYLGYQPQA